MRIILHKNTSWSRSIYPMATKMFMSFKLLTYHFNKRGNAMIIEIGSQRIIRCNQCSVMIHKLWEEWNAGHVHDLLRNALLALSESISPALYSSSCSLFSRLKDVLPKTSGVCLVCLSPCCCTLHQHSKRSFSVLCVFCFSCSYSFSCSILLSSKTLKSELPFLVSDDSLHLYLKSPSEGFVCMLDGTGTHLGLCSVVTSDLHLCWPFYSFQHPSSLSSGSTTCVTSLGCQNPSFPPDWQAFPSPFLVPHHCSLLFLECPRA